MMTHRRSLAVTRQFSGHQKEWFSALRARALAGEPLAVVGVDTPYEILAAMDIPFVVAPWWSSLLAARQKGTGLFDALERRGYPGNQSQYMSLGLAAAFAPELAPWDGLPTPSLFVSNQATGPEHKIMQLWARESHAPLFTFERYNMLEHGAQWWSGIAHDWEAVLRTEALDAMEEEVREFAALAVQVTGRHLEPDRLAAVMDLVNEQGRNMQAVSRMLAVDRPAVAGVAETIPATTIPQWHSGSRWGADATRALADELEARTVDDEPPTDQVRMMWMGNPPWFDLGIFDRIRDRGGAVFVWSMYLAVAADGYVRVGDDPFRALAARHGPHRDFLSSPPWNADWIAREAAEYAVAGSVHFVTDVDRGWEFIRGRLEAEGVPVLEVQGDAVDPRVTGTAELEERIVEFVTSVKSRQSPPSVA